MGTRRGGGEPSGGRDHIGAEAAARAPPDGDGHTLFTADNGALVLDGSPVAARIREAEAEPLAEAPEAVRARLAAERAAWGRVIRERGISLEG